MNIVRAVNITKNYAGHKALDKVSISIPENSIFALLGPNGAGKTTFIRILTQIIAPDEGQVFFKEKKLGPEEISLFGYLPEERGLYKKMRVDEQLIYLSRLKGISLKESKEKFHTWLEKMNLTSWSNRNVEDLSKGMQQKVQFIAAVIHEPPVIILDEPFTGFDPINAELIKHEILNLKKKGHTIILSTHRMESVEELCEQIVLINKSQKILEGSVQNIRNEFKSGMYVIEGKGNIPENSMINVINEEKISDNKKRWRINAELGMKSNEVLSALMKGIEVDLFREDLPTISDIFISKVKDQINE